MRRLRFIPALLAIFLTACSENIIEHSPDRESDVFGTLSIALSANMDNEVVGTRADADEPVLDDFRVAIYKSENQMRLFNDSYANASATEIKLNAGSYRLVAQHGDTLGYGFNKPYYLAEKDFVVEAGVNTVEAEAKLANVKIAVNYHETISTGYADYYGQASDPQGKEREVQQERNPLRLYPGR